MRCASALQHIIRLQTKDREKKKAKREREEKKAISPQEI